MIAYVTNVDAFSNAWNVKVALKDTDNGNVLVGPVSIPFSFTDHSTWEELKPLLPSALNQFCIDNEVTPPSSITWMIPTMDQLSPMMSPTVSSETRSFTTGTGATGFQVSATRNALVFYSTKVTVTASISGGAEGYIVLETCPTNSATAGDWVEIGRKSNGQTFSLAIALQGIQPVGDQLVGFIPAGHYARLRTVTVTGTVSFTYVSGTKVLY
jgi:hypothetical protein